MLFAQRGSHAISPQHLGPAAREGGVPCGASIAASMYSRPGTALCAISAPIATGFVMAVLVRQRSSQNTRERMLSMRSADATEMGRQKSPQQGE
jgi:hypothetical protein